jgi:hypothetical protein
MSLRCGYGDGEWDSANHSPLQARRSTRTQHTRIPASHPPSSNHSPLIPPQSAHPITAHTPNSSPLAQPQSAHRTTTRPPTEWASTTDVRPAGANVSWLCLGAGAAFLLTGTFFAGGWLDGGRLGTIVRVSLINFTRDSLLNEVIS